jgi:hypothetical protein
VSYTTSIAWLSLAKLYNLTPLGTVLRCILKKANQQMEVDEQAALDGANKARVEEAARLEGITMEQALENRKGFRYLY